jgi:transformation/transcription domain-associated protein
MENDSNIVNVFINRVIDPENPYGQSDSVRIFLLQLSSVFVQYAHEYIHDVNNKKHGQKLRRLMTYAWPCLLAKNCVDPFNKYHGHLVLSHLIAKFAIHKRIVFQVFHSLLKAYAPEAKTVVRNALDILTPSFPLKVDDGYTTLATWTKKILIDESHHVPQLAHMLYIIVKYHKVYYLIRHSLINHMINSFQKVGLPTNNAIDHKQLAIDLTEVILRWEAQRVKDTSEQHTNEQLEQTIAKHPDMLKPFEKHVADSVLNFFIKTSCPLSENGHGHSQNDQLSKRCLNLFKVAMLYDIWPNAEIKLEILERVFLILENSTAVNAQQQVQQQQAAQAGVASQQSSNSNQINYASICTALELITFLIGLYCTRKFVNIGYRGLNY